jgi:hypothetical protein
MDGLGWAHELVAAPDLETVGGVLHGRLKSYVGQPPIASERMLTERCSFEHQVRHYLARANERGFSFSRLFPGFPSTWVDFVNQNKSLEETIQRIDRHRAYEEGRNDHTQIEAAPNPKPFSHSLDAPPSSPISTIDPLNLIRSLVAETMQRHASTNQVAQTWQPQATVAAGTLAAVPIAGPTMSVALDLYLAPPDRKKAHLSKGSAETAAIVQFAIDFLSDPPLHTVSKEDWDRLDLALPDIPHSRDLPAEACSSLYTRYCYRA